VKINEKTHEMIQTLMKNHPNTKLSIGYLNKGETSFRLFDATGEIPYKSYAYEIASVSKVFTTSLLAKYLHEGKMNLYDSVATYIPDLQDGANYPTLKRLATHTAGIAHEALTYPQIAKVMYKYFLMRVRKKPTGYLHSFGTVDYEKFIWFAKRQKPYEDKDYKWCKLRCDYETQSGIVVMTNSDPGKDQNESLIGEVIKLYNSIRKGDFYDYITTHK
jgi:CubicO group peptidase (beta-lactamase class C family)